MEKGLPYGYTLRPAKAADHQEMRNLRRICEIHIGLATTPARTDPGRLYSWVVLDERGHIVGQAHLCVEGQKFFLISGGVHPAFQRRGIGTFLLHMLEREARELMRYVPEGTRMVLASMVNDQDASTLRLYKSQGYLPVRSIWQMGIDVKEPLAPVPSVQGITFQTAIRERLHALFEAREEVMRDHWGHVPLAFEEWADWVTERQGFDLSLWTLALDGEQIVGFVRLQDEQEAGVWGDELGVRRPWRRKGLAQALLLQALHVCAHRGFPRLHVLVDSQSLTGATRLVERMGMQKVALQEIYEKELCPGVEPRTLAIPPPLQGK